MGGALHKTGDCVAGWRLARAVGIYGDFYAQWEQGYDVIYGRRIKREMPWVYPPTFLPKLVADIYLRMETRVLAT